MILLIIVVTDKVEKFQRYAEMVLKMFEVSILGVDPVNFKYGPYVLAGGCLIIIVLRRQRH